MRVAVTGSSGLIGTALGERIQSHGHELVPVMRGSPEQPSALWDPAAGWFREGALDGVDAVVHLSGTGIADRRWTAARRRLLWESRVESARLLVDHIAGLSPRPKVLLSASAIGYYGDRGDETLTEDEPRGAGFLAELCEAWEREARRVEQFGVRAVQFRTAGSVLSRKGGVLPRVLTPFRLGAGGRLGNGRQWFSWISLQDEAGAIEHLIDTDSISGPVNLVSPNPVTNAEFTRTLARTLHRPAVLPLPAPALRLIFGALANETLLASQRVIPARLQQSGYAFAHPDLQSALDAALSE